jgi:hypothetical protein
MIFDTGQWPALALIREMVNLIESDADHNERAIPIFSSEAPEPSKAPQGKLNLTPPNA